MPEPEDEPRNVTNVQVRVEMEQAPPVTQAELDLVEAFMNDLITELLSDVPEETN